MKRILTPVLISVLALVVLVGGGAIAAVVLSHNGSVEVVAPPPPPPPPPVDTYTFALYDAASGGNVIADGNSAYFALGQVQTNSITSKTVYVQKTGTAASYTVTPAASWTGTAPGTITFNPTSVSLTDATRQSIVVTFTAGATATASTNFQIQYSESH